MKAQASREPKAAGTLCIIKHVLQYYVLRKEKKLLLQKWAEEMFIVQIKQKLGCLATYTYANC